MGGHEEERDGFKRLDYRGEADEYLTIHFER